MQAPNLVNNSYFFCAHSNSRFNDYIVDKLKPFKTQSSSINWVQDLSTLHCTLGFVFGKAMSPHQTQQLNQKLSTRTAKILNNIPSSLLTRIEGFDITKNGWIILKFAPNKKLHELHQNVIDELESQNLTPSKFSGNQFMAHVSIGSLKPGANLEAAKQELQQLFNKMMQDRFPFIVYDLELSHTINGANHSLVHHHLQRPDLGIQKVEKLAKRYVVKIDDYTHAAKLANWLLKFYNITSTTNPGQQKTITHIQKTNNFAIYLDQADYDKVSGVFNNLRT